MFHFFRKHQALALIFIGVVIVSFVIFFSPNQRMGNGPGGVGGALGTVKGRPVGRDEYVTTLKEARLAHMLRTGSWPGRGGRDWDEAREVIQRLVLLEEARGLGVQVTDEVAAARIVDLPFLKDDKTGAFNRASYDEFLAIVQREEGMLRADFEQFMRHEVAIQHLVQLGGMSGSLVPPREAEEQYRQGNGQYAGQLVVFSSTNQAARVDLSPARVSQYFSNRLAEYRIPERVQVRYAKFAATNFLAEAEAQVNSNTNLAPLLDAEYQRRGPDSFRGPDGKPRTPEEAKADLKAQFLRSVALEAARKKANEFANKLYQMEGSVESLSKLAADSGMQAQTSVPFDQFRPPFDMRVPQTFNRAAFALSAEEPFATPVVGDDGVYVYAFERRIPSEIPPFETVKERVTESYKRTEARSLAEAAGRAFSETAAQSLAQGKTFAEAAAAAGLKTIVLTNFSRATSGLSELGPRLTVSELLQVAEEVEPGKVGPFTAAADGGFVLWVESRKEAPDDQLKQELPAFLTQLRQMGRFSSFMEWEKHRIALAQFPGFRTEGATNAPAAAN